MLGLSAATMRYSTFLERFHKRLVNATDDQVSHSHHSNNITAINDSSIRASNQARVPEIDMVGSEAHQQAPTDRTTLRLYNVDPALLPRRSLVAIFLTSG
jgi:hypothetical protein